MRIHAIQQRSAEWHALRRGIPTASNFDRIILPTGKRSGQARKYLYQLAYERITERLFERDLSNITHVQHGIDNENTAVGVFETQSGLKTAPVGFITDDDGCVGCSPDRLVSGRNEAVEIKCPQGPTHCGYLIDGLQDAYKAQIQGQMLIGRFRAVHFFSWHPELPPFHQRVEPDDAFQVMLARYLVEFERELIAGVEHIKKFGNWPRNAPSVFPENEEEDNG